MINASLPNSDGCKRIPGRMNQRCAPLISLVMPCGNGNVARKSSITQAIPKQRPGDFFELTDSP